MKTLLVGAVGMLALQVLLVAGFLAMSKQTRSSSTLIAGALNQTASLWSCFAGRTTHPKVGVVKC